MCGPAQPSISTKLPWHKRMPQADQDCRALLVLDAANTGQENLNQVGEDVGEAVGGREGTLDGERVVGFADG